MLQPAQFLKNHWDFIPLFTTVGFAYLYASGRFYNRMNDDPDNRFGHLSEQNKVPHYVKRVRDKRVFSDDFQKMAMGK